MTNVRFLPAVAWPGQQNTQKLLRVWIPQQQARRRMSRTSQNPQPCQLPVQATTNRKQPTLPERTEKGGGTWVKKTRSCFHWIDVQICFRSLGLLSLPQDNRLWDCFTSSVALINLGSYEHSNRNSFTADGHKRLLLTNLVKVSWTACRYLAWDTSHSKAWRACIGHKSVSFTQSLCSSLFGFSHLIPQPFPMSGLKGRTSICPHRCQSKPSAAPAIRMNESSLYSCLLCIDLSKPGSNETLTSDWLPNYSLKHPNRIL